MRRRYGFGYNLNMAAHTHGATSGRLLWISLGLTVAFVLIELFYGISSHSLALISDAGHNASDALALGLAAYAVWVSRRPASHGKTFGYHRVAILTALINAASLVIIAFGILLEAYHIFRHPEPVQGSTMIIVASIAVVMNTVVAYWLRGESHHSLNARAAYIHMAGDAISSLGVVIAGVVVSMTGIHAADPIVSILIAGFILYSSWGIIIDAANILLEGTPKGLDVDALVTAIRDTPPVIDLHDLHIWTVGDGMHFLSCHIVLPDTFVMSDQTTLLRELNERLLHDFGITHATIQTEIDGCDGCHIHPESLYCALESGHQHGCGHEH